MVSRSRVALLGISLASLLACNTIVMDISKSPAVSQPIEDRKSFWFWGSTSQDVDMRAICPAGTARIVEETTFVDGLIGQLTLGIYGPRSSYYWCVAP